MSEFLFGYLIWGVLNLQCLVLISRVIQGTIVRWNNPEGINPWSPQPFHLSPPTSAHLPTCSLTPGFTVLPLLLGFLSNVQGLLLSLMRVDILLARAEVFSQRQCCPKGTPDSVWRYL